jgi:methionine synthase I (cobalamin-dependent)
MTGWAHHHASIATRYMSDAQPTPAYDQLQSLLEDRILILDGAMGTMVQALHLSNMEPGWKQFARAWARRAVERIHAT